MSTPVTNSVNLRRRVSATERVRFYDRGRVCAHPGCATILSVYNPAKYCSTHLEEARSGQRRGVSRSVREVACEQCGIPFKTRNPRRRYCSDNCRMAAFARRKRASAELLRQAEQMRAAASIDKAAEPAGEPASEAAAVLMRSAA